MYNILTQITSQIPSARALAFTSVDNVATTSCFFYAHDTSPPANLNIHPVIDFLSIQGCYAKPTVSSHKIETP
jgi:hypothetical protein